MSVEGLANAIVRFPEQFTHPLKIENRGALPQKEGVVACGMGGSSLVALLMRDLQPRRSIVVHRDYGLPDSPETLQKSLVIVSSLSGNTEEALSSFQETRERNLHVAVISGGGRLLQMAQEDAVPYIKLPDLGVQTNHALGLYIIAFLQLLDEKTLLEEARKLATTLVPGELAETGRRLAEKLVGKTLVHIYASWRDQALAYNWKIRIDESAKTLAVCNFFPEVNHGEIEAICATAVRGCSPDSLFLFLQDPYEDYRIKRRMAITAQLYQEKGLAVETLRSHGATKLERFFASTLLADWITYYMAEHYDHDPEFAAFVEEFKQRMGS